VHAWLTERAIDVAALLAAVTADGNGGTVVFVGTERPPRGGGDAGAIEYSAYREMAEPELARIVQEALAKWPGARIALQHRLGVVPTGEASLVIAVSAPHRADAYAASRFAIEETKRRAPIWKKERLASGAGRWVEGRPAGGEP